MEVMESLTESTIATQTDSGSDDSIALDTRLHEFLLNQNKPFGVKHLAIILDMPQTAVTASLKRLASNNKVQKNVNSGKWIGLNA